MARHSIDDVLAEQVGGIVDRTSLRIAEAVKNLAGDKLEKEVGQKSKRQRAEDKKQQEKEEKPAPPTKAAKRR